MHDKQPFYPLAILPPQRLVRRQRPMHGWFMLSVSGEENERVFRGDERVDGFEEKREECIVGYLTRRRETTCTDTDELVALKVEA